MNVSPYLNFDGSCAEAMAYSLVPLCKATTPAVRLW
jgi:hypothetical protein